MTLWVVKVEVGTRSAKRRKAVLGSEGGGRRRLSVF
jgi:hypothetical protein